MNLMHGLKLIIVLYRPEVISSGQEWQVNNEGEKFFLLFPYSNSGIAYEVQIA